MIKFKHLPLLGLLVLAANFACAEINKQSITVPTIDTNTPIYDELEKCIREIEQSEHASSVTNNDRVVAETSKSPNVLYRIVDVLGSITDPLFTRGELSAENKTLFEDVAKKLGIDNRQIKARNTGLLFRLLLGYQNAAALQHVNRVYINEDWLNEMSEGEKRFLIAHELIHHRNHDVVKRIGAAIIFAGITKAIVNRTQFFSNDSMFKRYFLHPQSVFSFGSHPIINAIAYKLTNLGFLGLMTAQMYQHQETEADTQAITIGDALPEDGKTLFSNHLYNPTTTNWPMYAKVMTLFSKPIIKIMALPIFKQHAEHLVSVEDRMAHLDTVPTQK